MAMAVRKLTRSVAFAPRRWTDRKREVVQASWRALLDGWGQGNTEKVGVEVLRRLFQKHPAFVHLFSFRDQPKATLFLSAPVRLHARLVAETLSRIVGELGDPVAMEKTLRELGNRHKTKMVKRAHYKAFGAALLSLLSDKLTGEEFRDETRRAWQEIWALISSTMMKATPDN